MSSSQSVACNTRRYSMFKMKPQEEDYSELNIDWIIDGSKKTECFSRFERYIIYLKGEIGGLPKIAQRIRLHRNSIKNSLNESYKNR